MDSGYVRVHVDNGYVRVHVDSGYLRSTDTCGYKECVHVDTCDVHKLKTENGRKSCNTEI